MVFDYENEIILDSDALEESYLPASIPGRDSHIREILKCVSPAIKGQKPLCAWLYGRPGTGKTTVACHVLSYLNNTNRIPGVYVNCWKYNTFYSVLDYIMRETRKGFGDARDTAVKLSQFEQMVRDRPFLIVLDEIDLFHSGERNDMIYNLHSIGKVGLICISESRRPILDLEPRIKSRLSPQIIPFEPYSDTEVIEILKNRAAKALHPNSWSHEVATLIARKAEGDARIAIQTLRNAAVYADSDKTGVIMPVHIEKGFTDTGALKRTYGLKKLTEHHRLLYKIVKEYPGIPSPILYSRYLEECAQRNWKPVASRTYSLYMKKMADLKLIEAQRARLKGRIYSFRIYKDREEAS